MVCSFPPTRVLARAAFAHARVRFCCRIDKGAKAESEAAADEPEEFSRVTFAESYDADDAEFSGHVRHAGGGAGGGAGAGSFLDMAGDDDDDSFFRELEAKNRRQDGDR